MRSIVLHPIDDLPKELADQMRSRCGKKYRPSNGTEGMIFMENWCSQCSLDKTFSEGKNIDDCSEDELCEIIGLTMACDVEDDEYPKEWVYDINGQPCCTAFLPIGATDRCKKTIDMFEGK